MNKKCIVLDLDETLVHSETIRTQDWTPLSKELVLTPDQHERFYDLDLGDDYRVIGFERPYCQEFLTYCLRYFDPVIIWSAGSRDYVELMISHIFQNQVRSPHTIFAWENCDVTIDKEGNKNARKPLQFIYNRFPKCNEKNTLFIDDREDYAEKDLLNWICIPPYEIPDITELDGIRKVPKWKDNDDILERIMTWCSNSGVLKAKDVRTVNKQFLHPEVPPE